MQSDLFQRFINAIPLLTTSQRQVLEESLHQTRIAKTPELEEASQTDDQMPLTNDPSSLEIRIEAAFALHPVCPHCNGDNGIQRWGQRKGRQRYFCITCDKTFGAFTDTPLAHLRYPEKWGEYLEGMPESQTLRTAAKRCNIDLKTSFRWRHRFLEVIDPDQAEVLQGVVELDETLFDESFKGQREGLPRPARKRGNDKNKARKSASTGCSRSPATYSGWPTE